MRTFRCNGVWRESGAPASLDVSASNTDDAISCANAKGLLVDNVSEIPPTSPSSTKTQRLVLVLSLIGVSTGILSLVVSITISVVIIIKYSDRSDTLPSSDVGTKSQEFSTASTATFDEIKVRKFTFVDRNNVILAVMDTDKNCCPVLTLSDKGGYRKASISCGSLLFATNQKPRVIISQDRDSSSIATLDKDGALRGEFGYGKDGAGIILRGTNGRAEFDYNKKSGFRLSDDNGKPRMLLSTEKLQVVGESGMIEAELGINDGGGCLITRDANNRTGTSVGYDSVVLVGKNRTTRVITCKSGISELIQMP